MNKDLFPGAGSNRGKGAFQAIYLQPDSSIADFIDYDATLTCTNLFVADQVFEYPF